MNDTVGTALQLLGVNVALGRGGQRHEVLRSLDLALAHGRWTCVVGPNGAGKSTLLKTLAGLLRPDAGEVRWQGRSLAQWHGTERARHLAWLGQGGELQADDLTVMDVALLGRLPHHGWWSAPGPADWQVARWALEQTEAWDWRERPMAALSGGERQRVLLARALAVQAAVLLMDEPLANLDPPHQAEWWCLVRRLVAEGRTVVTVLHEVGMALQADVLVVLDHGRVLHQGEAHARDTHAALEQVFQRRLRIARVEGHWVALPR